MKEKRENQPEYVFKSFEEYDRMLNEWIGYERRYYLEVYRKRRAMER